MCSIYSECKCVYAAFLDSTRAIASEVLRLELRPGHAWPFGDLAVHALRDGLAVVKKDLVRAGL